jgi:TolB protein
MDEDGKNVVQITTGPMQHVHPSFSPDGGRLVYSSFGSKSGQWELWMADLTTGEKSIIGFGLFPTWSPSKDVDRIAFQKARQRGSRWFSLWTLDLVDGEARQVTEVAVSSNAAIVAPTWSPDGQKLAFATIAQPTKDLNGKTGGQKDIWTINSDGTNRQRVTDGIGINISPCWSADNQIYFISDRCGAECVWSVRYDGEDSKARVAEKPHSEPVGDANGN